MKLYFSLLIASNILASTCSFSPTPPLPSSNNFHVGKSKTKSKGKFHISQQFQLHASIHTTSTTSTSNEEQSNEKTGTDHDASEILQPSDRRTFFQKTTLSTASAMLASLSLVDSASASASASEKTLRSSLTIAEAAVSTSTSASASALSPSASAIDLPPMGLGAWAWGDAIFWGYNPKQDDDLHTVFDYALSKNIGFFDTAELYGIGRSETLLGNFRRDADAGESAGDKVQIATKFAALPFRTKSKDVVKACRDSLKRLNPDGTKSLSRPIDLYQIHFPNAWSNENYWDGLAQCYEEGLVKAVGVSNYGVDALRAVHSKLAERGIPLATNQIQLSLLYRFPLENGLLDACDDLGVKVLSYSPLALGFLTGKYDKVTRPSGPRASIAKQLFDGENGDAISDLLAVMKIIAGNHGDVPLSQVAINWTRSKGTIPIPGARSLKQAKQNIAALDWELTGEEVLVLDAASAKTPAYISPDKSPFPKEDINTHLKMFDS